MSLKKYFAGFKGTILRYLILTAFVPLIISLSIIYIASRSALFTLYEQNLQNSVNSILKMCEAQSDNIDSKLKDDMTRAINVSWKELSKFKRIYISDSTVKANVTDQITMVKSTISLPGMMADNKNLRNSFSFVDDILDRMNIPGASVTIYQLFDEKLISISSTKKVYENRDILTFLPKESPIYSSVVSGKSYEERTITEDSWSLTHYKPILSVNDKVIGALCNVIPIPRTALFDIIRQSKIGEKGYIYVINSQGLAIEHPLYRYENLIKFKDPVTGNEFIKDIISQKEGFFRYSYSEISESEVIHEKIAYIRNFPKWDWFIIATINKDEILSSLSIVFKILIILLSVLSVVLLFASTRVVKSIFKPLKVIIDTAVKVSGGNLNVFIPQDHYNKCVKVKNCSYRECPAYESRNLACWRVDGTLCNNGKAFSSNEEKMEYCCDCEVYQKSIRNETDELIEAINNMIISIREIIDEIQVISTELSTESNSLSEISAMMETETQNQAASIEETTSSNEELMASIENVSDSARTQADKVSQTSAAMEELTSSTRLVGENAATVSNEAKNSVTTAHETDKMLKETTMNINHVSESSQKIVAIVAMINDISDQINLLSLNAAIEAARAGEHGKGFAVVAEEISKLADATARSTREIEDVIKKSRTDIQSGAELLNKTAAAITEMMQRIEISARLFLEIAESSNEQIKGSEQVMKDVEEINSMSSRIAMATEEQKATSNEILKALSRVNESIQEIANSSQVVSTSSQSLKKKSRELKDIIDKF